MYYYSVLTYVIILSCSTHFACIQSMHCRHYNVQHRLMYCVLLHCKHRYAEECNSPVRATVAG